MLSADAENELRSGVHKLETLLESAIDKNFDRFEIYVLRNLLMVPEELVPWVRLAHHEVSARAPATLEKGTKAYDKDV